MYARAWQANDPSNAHLGYFSTIVKPTFNKNRDMRCINYPGIALVGPGLQAPMIVRHKYDFGYYYNTKIAQNLQA